MITEKSIIDKIEILNGNIIQVREVTIITKDDVEIARTYHRWSFTPLDDLSAMPQEVKDIAKAVFTDEVKQTYVESMKASV